MEIRRLTLDDFYELRDLLSTVFTKHNKKPSQFDQMFPRLFGQENSFAPESHLGAFEDGKLIGTAAMYPIDYVVGGKHIRLIGNGNIAVHEDYRGRGVMSALLTKVNEECDRCGDVCYLHGDPVRYGRVGYVGGGIQYLLIVPPGKDSGLAFRPMVPEDVPALNELSRTKPDYVMRRDADFIPALRSCGREPVTVLDSQGQIAGYLSFHREESHVEEYAFYSPWEAQVFPQLAAAAGRSITVIISGYYPDAAERCREVSDIRVQQPALFRIIHPEPLREAARSLGLDDSVLYAPYLT